MTLTVRLLCFVLALILFGVAALGLGSGRFNTVAAGLFFLTLGLAVG